MTATDPGKVAGRAIHVSETLTAAMAADRNAVHATTALYTAHYRSLVGLAVLLVRDMSTAEEIVQDSFVAMHTNWRTAPGQRQGIMVSAAVCGQPVPFGDTPPYGG